MSSRTLNFKILHNRKNALLALAAGLALLLAACAPELPEDGAGGPIDCGAEDLVPPAPTSPAEDEIISDLEYLFVWDYLSCEPEDYVVEVAPLGDWDSPAAQSADTLSGLTTNWTFSTPQEPASEYEWRIAARSEGEQGPWSPSVRFFTGPLCATEDLVAPITVYPGGSEVVDSLGPIFEWNYPDDCVPEGYRIDVGLFGHSFAEDSTVSGGTGNPSTRWTTAEDLEPVTQYEWRVAAINGTTLADYSASASFWTGPVCASADLISPQQNTPADGATVDNPFPPMGWSYLGGCLPELTNLELDTDPAFPGPNLVDGLGAPRIGQIPIDALDDCEQYYWRVRSENSDGSTSDWSPTWTFFTDFDGLCPGSGGSTMGIADRDLNCRAGDSTVFTETGFLASGEETEILGRNRAGTWLVAPLGLGGENCWLSALYVDLPDGVLDGLEVFSSPPTPTPEPTATPQPSISQEFAVTDVSVSVDQQVYQGNCPVQFTFTATITTNGAGTVHYEWLRSDQVSSSEQTIEFTAAGSQQVLSTWDLTSGTHENLWKALQINAPNNLTSNQAVFSVYCN